MGNRQESVYPPSLSLCILLYPCQGADLLQGPGKQACHSRSLGHKGVSDSSSNQREGLWVVKAAAALPFFWHPQESWCRPLCPVEHHRMAPDQITSVGDPTWGSPGHTDFWLKLSRNRPWALEEKPQASMTTRQDDSDQDMPVVKRDCTPWSSHALIARGK